MCLTIDFPDYFHWEQQYFSITEFMLQDGTGYSDSMQPSDVYHLIQEKEYFLWRIWENKINKINRYLMQY